MKKMLTTAILVVSSKEKFILYLDRLIIRELYLYLHPI